MNVHTKINIRIRTTHTDILIQVYIIQICVHAHGRIEPSYLPARVPRGEAPPHKSDQSEVVPQATCGDNLVSRNILRETS